MTEEITVGQRVRDKISGFEGIAVSRTEFLYGCHRVAVHPEDADDTDQKWFDEPQLEIVDDGMVDEVEETKSEMSTTGGDRPDAVRKSPTG